MLKTETLLLSQWYDFEELRELRVFCECGALINDDVLEACADVVCPECGETAKFSELDVLADSLEWPVPHT